MRYGKHTNIPLDQLKNRFTVPLGKKWRRMIKYDRIRTDGLTCEDIRAAVKKKGFRGMPDISETPDSFRWQYGDYPAVFVNKTTGRIVPEDVITKENWKQVTTQMEKFFSVMARGFDPSRVENWSYSTWETKKPENDTEPYVTLWDEEEFRAAKRSVI